MTVRPQISGQPGGILFLADAPGAEDDIKGRPLVGGEGFLLARALRMASLTDPSAVPSEFEPSLLGETRRLLWERRAHSFANRDQRVVRGCGRIVPHAEFDPVGDADAPP